MNDWVIKGKDAEEIRMIHQRLCQATENPISLDDVVRVMSLVGLLKLRKMTTEQFIQKLRKIEK